MSRKREGKPDYVRRLEEANRLIQLGFHRDAVESASGGIELLIKVLFDELRDALLNTGDQADREKAIGMKCRYDDLAKDNEPKGKFTFGEWIGFFESEDIFDELYAVFRGSGENKGFMLNKVYGNRCVREGEAVDAKMSLLPRH